MELKTTSNSVEKRAWKLRGLRREENAETDCLLWNGGLILKHLNTESEYTAESVRRKILRGTKQDFTLVPSTVFSDG